MFEKRRIAAPAGLGGLACLGILVAVSLPAGPGVTHANFRRVEVGMTQAEAEAVFGVAASDTAPNGRIWWGLHLL
jgi:hypothetical protein